jgi:hypothetical protein
MSYLGNPPVVNASRLVYDAYATQGQTVITPPGGYTVGQVEVIINGSQLSADDFTATDGSTIVLAQGMGLNDTIKIVAYGTFAVANTYSQAQVDSKVATVNANIAAIGPSFKNRLINGDMRIDQRNNGAAVTNAGGYIIDRWGDSMAGSGRYTAQRVASAPSGFSYSFQHTVTTAVTPSAGDIYQVYQFIEGLNMADLGFGTANAQNITLSFWVRSSIAGTYAVSLKNGSGRTFLSTYTVNSANTWEYKTVVITGDTGGTWAIDNTAWGFICFDLGSGSNANSSTTGSWQVGDYRRTSSCVNLIATNGATFNITGVQIEKGNVATSFDYRPYQAELSLCERYYELCTGAFYSSTVTALNFYGAGVNFRSSKRGTPTVTRVADTGSSGVTGSPYAEAINVQGFRTMAQSSGTNINWSTIFKAESEL